MTRVSNHFRIRPEEQTWIRAIIERRRSGDISTEVAREALNIGLLVLLATAPDEVEPEPVTDETDTGAADDDVPSRAWIARRLRPVIASVMDVLHEEGQLPASTAVVVTAPPSPPGQERTAPPDASGFQVDRASVQDMVALGLAPLGE